MVHLSSPVVIGFMFLFSYITFILAPTLTRPYFGKMYKDQCPIGFTLGFLFCLLLWNFIVKKIAYSDH